MKQCAFPRECEAFKSAEEQYVAKVRELSAAQAEIERLHSVHETRTREEIELTELARKQCEEMREALVRERQFRQETERQRAALEAEIERLREALASIKALPAQELSSGVDSTMRPVVCEAYSAFAVRSIVDAAIDAQRKP